ncbi:MAG: hypothetical protein EOP39_08690 [Rubrivivax sp.]|nr:MAG: hypothetical protein EOP39_08690 [Rubrivivax sp.]
MRKTAAILIAGFVAGAVDLLGALASYTSKGATVDGILKYIATGLVGPSAMQGGAGMVALGLACHFGLTILMAAAFVAASLKISDLTRRPWLWGTVYGVITWAVMVYVAVPMSGVPGWKLPQGWDIVSGLLAHIFYVGVPIAFIAQWGLREPGYRAG